jgi:anti-sigma B factor antagonist
MQRNSRRPQLWVTGDGRNVVAHAGSRMTTIRIAGEVDLACAHQLRAALRGLTGDAVLDCSELSFIDSTRLSVVLGAHRRFEAEGHCLQLVDVSQAVHRTLRVAGLDRVLLVEAAEQTES